MGNVFFRSQREIEDVKDYPHPDSVWPNSREAIERQMPHVSPEMRRKLTHDNAAALYGLGGA